ncbi:MAG: hypothetical protein AB1758_13410 [Candidatus Eremiobacterota bacterium]
MSRPDAPRVEPKVYLVSAALVGGALLLLLLLVTFLPEPAKPTRDRARARARGHDDPVLIAQSFLAQLRSGHPDGAYRLLSSQVTRRLAPEVFRKRVDVWMSEAQNRWDLRYRKVTAGVRRDQTAEVLVVAPGTRMRSWTWQLERESSQWRLVHVEGLHLGLSPPSSTDALE